MDEFFVNNIIGVFFFYGLAFFSMGLAVLLEARHSSGIDFARALKPLAAFGLLHGSHEWFEMGLIIYNQLTNRVEANWVFYLRIVMLGVSFLLLIAFGIQLVLGPGKQRTKMIIMAVIVVLWCAGLFFVVTPTPTRIELTAADVYTRYSLAIPGAALTAWGFILQRRMFQKAGMQKYGLDVTVAAIAFALYGGIGQLFASPSNFGPSVYVNSEVFLEWFGIPVQGFRALMAILAAVFVIRSMNAFDEENRRRYEALSEAQKAERQHLQELRAELLHRTVNAQELERKRIARELHDETGQMLTALGLGLSALAKNITAHPERAVEQATQLQKMATNGLNNLQRLVSGLRPPQLDELGLVPALRWYAQEIHQHYKLPVTVTSNLNGAEIVDEVRLTLFRIAQEAITNSIRHSRATQIQINVEMHGTEINLTIVDDGQGFDAPSVLRSSTKGCIGLLGMIERATLIGGICKIYSSPGEGTTVEVKCEIDKEKRNYSDLHPAG